MTVEQIRAELRALRDDCVQRPQSVSGARQAAGLALIRDLAARMPPCTWPIHSWIVLAGATHCLLCGRPASQRVSAASVQEQYLREPWQSDAEFERMLRHMQEGRP